MDVIQTELPDVLVIEPRVFGDERGWFLEQWNAERYRSSGIAHDYVQDNLSMSGGGVVRGLHYQKPHAQGKLVYVLVGAVYDVAVDLRLSSPTFGRWVGMTLSADNHRQLWIPPGFAHGFCTLSESVLFSYKCTVAYHPEAERTILWNDPEIGIVWPIDSPVLSPKDAAAARLADVARDTLPD